MDEAIAEYRAAIRLKPDYSEAHNNLGEALADKGQADEAIAEYRAAVKLGPGNAEAHFNLGNALDGKGQADEAIAEYRAAIRLKPDFSEAHNNLGEALAGKGQVDEAITEHRAAVKLRPGNAEAHNNLGLALAGKGQVDEAIAEYRAAIRLKPDFSEAHNNLGNALDGKGQVDEAIAEYRAAVKLGPGNAEAHNDLGLALDGKGQVDEAIAEYRAAIRLKPDYSEAHYNLGNALQQKGRFGEALSSLRRGHELGSQQPDWPDHSGQMVHDCEQRVKLEGRLPAVLHGEDHPADADERAKFAWMCYFKGLSGASAHLFEEALAAKPELAENMDAGHRYNAACAAALAGSGRGRDDPPLDEEDRTRWRKRALDWLRADLEVWKPRAASPIKSTRDSVIQTLQHWLRDPDLAGLRDNDALENLPEGERDKWRTFWAKVRRARSG